MVGLTRAVGVPALFSTAYGNVGSSIYYALGVTAASALGLTPVVFMFAGLLFACTALSYAEATAAIPEAGGSSSFARKSLNEGWSFLAGWALMLDYIITIAISALFVPHYLGAFWPSLRHPPGNVIGGIIVVAILVWLNVRGIRESGLVNILLAVADILTQAVLVGAGLWLLLSWQTLISNVHWAEAPTWHQLLYGVSIAMIAYTGIETISNMAEEARAPERSVPKAISLVFVAVLAMYAGISITALSAMPVVRSPEGAWTTELATRYLEDPVLGIAAKLPVPALREFFHPWIGILAATILFIGTNAGIIGVSRLAYSMGLYQQLPPSLSRVHPRYRTPYRSIIAFGAVAALLILPGHIELLADLYSFGAMLAFSTAHVCVIVLRIRQPDLARPFKIPFNIKIRDREIPITAAVGLLGTLTTWLVVVITHPWGRTVGFAWIAIGATMYVAYRKANGLPLMRTAERRAA
jgi:APA family basic amino acid/polyamine antiporter